MDVLVTGGTGPLGRLVVERLQVGGSRVRQMSRRGTGPGGVRGDLATGRDLPTALAGAEVVVHAATGVRDRAYWEVDVAGTRRLVQAGGRGPVPHLGYNLIVGAHPLPLGHYP